MYINKTLFGGQTTNTSTSPTVSSGAFKCCFFCAANHFSNVQQKLKKYVLRKRKTLQTSVKTSNKSNCPFFPCKDFFVQFCLIIFFPKLFYFSFYVLHSFFPLHSQPDNSSEYCRLLWNKAIGICDFMSTFQLH